MTQVIILANKIFHSISRDLLPQLYTNIYEYVSNAFSNSFDDEPNYYN